MTKPSRARQRDKVVVRVNEPWVAVPRSMMFDKSIGRNERFLCALLYMWRANDDDCYPLQEQMADVCGVEIRTIQKWLDTLIKAHYVIRRRTMYGNRYELINPKDILTNTITGSHADTTLGSPHTITGSCTNTITGSHASITKNQQYLESPSPCPPPSLDGGDDGNTDSIRAEEYSPTAKLLLSLKIAVWKELAEELKDIPYTQVERRVNELVDQGKGNGIIVTNLRKIPFLKTPQEERPPLPRDAEYWHSQGVTVGDEGLEQYRQQLERSDPELAAFFREAGL